MNGSGAKVEVRRSRPGKVGHDSAVREQQCSIVRWGPVGQSNNGAWSGIVAGSSFCSNSDSALVRLGSEGLRAEEDVAGSDD